MMLAKLLEGVTVSKMVNEAYGQMVITHDLEFSHIHYDSRKVERGDLFVALRGSARDGHMFIADAIRQGARAVLLEDDTALPDSYFLHAGTAKIVVPDTRIALAHIAANAFGRPADHLRMVGVTGTNGKTTTAHLIRSVLEAAGLKTGLLGTVEYRIGDRVFPATHTTPESLELHELLARMTASGCTASVMEVSSHALDQHRVEGIRYEAAVFTNLTQDHLDYHGSMNAYFSVKRRLFENLEPTSWAVVNDDDPWAERIISSTSAQVLRYGFSSAANVRARDVTLSLSGIRCKIEFQGQETAFTSPLLGAFNLSNCLAAYATCAGLGVPRDIIQETLAHTQAVRGRFEILRSPAGWTVVIDYAHTPDALEKALRAIRDVVKAGGPSGRVITVFGCGGNRDHSKRSRMGAIATELGDITVITSDNPRHEDPEMIIDEIMMGVRVGASVSRIADRKMAIHKALAEAASGDVILIAGKGHEDYQVIGDAQQKFSDRETVEEFMGGNA